MNFRKEIFSQRPFLVVIELVTENPRTEGSTDGWVYGIPGSTHTPAPTGKVIMIENDSSKEYHEPN